MAAVYSKEQVEYKVINDTVKSSKSRIMDFE